MSFLADLYGDFDNDESELRYWEEVLEMNSNEEELEEQQENEVSSSDESSDNESEDSEFEEHTEGIPNANEDSDDDEIDVGGPENLGPFQTMEQAIEELEGFAQRNNFSVVKKGSNYDKEIEGKPRTMKNATYVCTRHGEPELKKYVPKSDQVAHRNTESQRCGCEFRAYISRQRKGTSYNMTMTETKHNHSLPKEPSSNLRTKKKITPEQIKLIISLHKAGASPTSIKETLNQQYPKQLFHQKSVYNAIGKARREELNGLTPIQFLINKLNNDMYKTDVVLSGDNGRVECLFILSKDSLSLYNRFPTALVMDATYKTNRFGMPLVQVCGITNENKTFVLCQAFMRSEHEGKYEWLLAQMKKHCFINHVPVSISTDRDLSLLNAIRTELPEVKHLLCRWHISKNVLAHIPKVFNGLEKDSVDTILKGWNTLVSSHTQEEYSKNLAALVKNLPKRNTQGTVYNPSLFKDYIMDTWLQEHKEKFVSVWTDKFTHLGTTSSSRIEGAHAILKRHLRSSTSDLNTVFERMDTLLKHQHTEIMVRSQKQLVKSNNQFRPPLFNGILKTITRHALKKAFEKFAQARIDILTKNPKKKLKPCTGSFTKVLGIPCAHSMKEKLTDSECESYKKEDFHQQWWIGRLDDIKSIDNEHDDPFSNESVQSMKEMYDSLPAHEKVIAARLVECLKTGQFPYSLENPTVVKSKGRPKGAGNRKQDNAKSSTQRNSSAFEYAEQDMKKSQAKRKREEKERSLSLTSKKVKTEQEVLSTEEEQEDVVVVKHENEYGSLLPKFYYEIDASIDENSYDAIINIKGDGFCGFRTLAHQLFDNQDNFFRVKFEMRDKLIEVEDTYKKIFPNFLVDELKKTVMYGIGNAQGDNKIMLKKPYSCDNEFWFLAPECAQLAACTFNRPVCVYYTGAAFTYLPILPSKPRPQTAPLYMHIVQTSLGTKPNHWITLKFKMSIKNTLPMIDSERSNAFSALGKPSDDLFWKKCHLTFSKPDVNDADEGDDAVVAVE